MAKSVIESLVEDQDLDTEEELRVTTQGNEDDDAEEEIVDFVVGSPPPVEDQTPEKYRGMSQKDLLARMEQLEAQAGTNTALLEGLRDLGQTLKGPTQQVMPVKPPTLEFTPEEEEELNTKLATDENPARLVKKLLLDKVGAVTQYQTAQSMAQMSQMKEELLELKDPDYRRWKPQVQAKLQTLSPDQRVHPEALKWALTQVKAENLETIKAEAITAAKEELKKELGLGGSGGNPRPPRLGGGGGSGGGAVGGNRRTEYATAEEEQALRQRAARRMMDWETMTPKAKVTALKALRAEKARGR